jgi:hypothetical protein
MKKIIFLRLLMKDAAVFSLSLWLALWLLAARGRAVPTLVVASDATSNQDTTPGMEFT